MLHTELIPAVDPKSRRLMVMLHGLGDSIEGFRWLPEAMNTLVGFDFQCDKIAARATDDDSAVRYFHACTVVRGLESDARQFAPGLPGSATT